MKDAHISYDLPTTRESGLPLPAAEIAGVEISLSADAGANFVVVDTVVPPSMGLDITQLENGTWIARLIVIDTAGQRSMTVDQPFVSDDSAPGIVTNVNVALT